MMPRCEQRVRLLLTIFTVLTTVCNADCTATDYIQAISGTRIEVEDIHVVLNQYNQALVSASYTESETVDTARKQLVYLFGLDDCSYYWYMQGDPLMTGTSGVAWNYEETKAYVVS